MSETKQPRFKWEFISKHRDGTVRSTVTIIVEGTPSIPIQDAIANLTLDLYGRPRLGTFTQGRS